MLDTLQTLTAVVASEERRIRKIERRVQWLAGGVMAFVAGALLLGWQPGRLALADVPQINPMASMGLKIEEFNRMVSNFNQLAESALPLMQDLKETEEKLEADENGVSKTTLRCDANVMKNGKCPSPFQTMMQAFNDTAILLARVKQDSDVLRKGLLQEAGLPETAINSEAASPSLALHQLNKAMADQLTFLNANIIEMNRNMGIMSYSVGSTMGRAGSWMP